MKLDERAQRASRAVHVAVEDVSPSPLPSRRAIAARRAAIALVLVAIVGYFSNQLLDNLASLRVETADQPPSEVKKEGSRDEDGKSDSLAPGPVSSVGPSRTGGTSSPGSRGSSKDSGPGGSLPAGMIPQGSEIAFNRGSDIYLMHGDGTGPRKLSSGVAPAWSPDGKRVAFSDNNDYAGGDLRSVNVDGSDSLSLSARGTFPSWAPDGERLAFNWPCDEQAGRPCSPEQPELACGPECGIGIVARDGTGVRRLGTGLWPDWAPSGRIIFTDGVAEEPCEYQTTFATFAGDVRVQQPECELPVWVMNADGSGRTRLPIDKAISPTWSRDGRRIAYYTETAGVFIANSDGSGIVKVAPADYNYMHPSWSPDGLWLALARRTTGYGSTSIYVRAIDGSGEKQLTPAPGNDALPAFSPQR